MLFKVIVILFIMKNLLYIRKTEDRFLDPNKKSGLVSVNVSEAVCPEHPFRREGCGPNPVSGG